MQSTILIAPVAILDQAEAFAQASGLPAGQFTQPYGADHIMCHFRPTADFLAALDGPIPEWVQIIDCDADPVAWDADKIGVFLSAALDGWAHLATVDAWPRA